MLLWVEEEPLWVQMKTIEAQGVWRHSNYQRHPASSSLPKRTLPRKYFRLVENDFFHIHRRPLRRLRRENHRLIAAFDQRRLAAVLDRLPSSL